MYVFIFMKKINFVAGKILLFYLIFYAVLAAFFGGLLAVFWQTLETEKPKYELAQSIIGTNPGLGFRPMPPEANLGSTLVWYKANRPDNMRYWHDTVDKFLGGKRIFQFIFIFVQSLTIDCSIYLRSILPNTQNIEIRNTKRTLIRNVISTIQPNIKNIASSELIR